RALGHLQQAEAGGVPEADQARLHYRLGQAYFHSGDLARAIEMLGRSVATGADNPAEGYGLLVQAHLEQTRPDREAALRATRKLLDNSNDEGLSAPARPQRGELLLRPGLRGEALKVLERIGPTTPRALRSQARCLLARCCQDEGLWAKAAPLW